MVSCYARRDFRRRMDDGGPDIGHRAVQTRNRPLSFTLELSSREYQLKRVAQKYCVTRLAKD